MEKRAALSFLIVYLGISSAVLSQQTPQSPAADTAANEQLRSRRITFDNVAGALGIIFGIVAVIAYLDQRRAMREQADVMRLVKRTIKKEDTEESISALTQQLKELEKQTKDEIPKIARRAVLAEQSERLKRDISQTYLQWREVERELGESVAGALDPGLERAVADRLLPSYERKQRDDRIRARLSVLGAAIAVGGILLPYPLSRTIQIGLGLWLGWTIFQQVNLGSVRQRRPGLFRWGLRIVLLVAVGSCGFVSYLILVDAGESITPTGRFIGWSIAASGGVLLVASYWLDKFFMKWLTGRGHSR